jgi:hypothetical protein
MRRLKLIKGCKYRIEKKIYIRNLIKNGVWGSGVGIAIRLRTRQIRVRCRFQWVCSRSLAGIADLNPAMRVDVCVVCLQYRLGTSQLNPDKKPSAGKMQRVNKRRNSGRK